MAAALPPFLSMAHRKKRIEKLFAKPSREDYVAAAKVIEFWRALVTAYDHLNKRRHTSRTSRPTAFEEQHAEWPRERFDGLVAALAHYDASDQRGVTLLNTWRDPSSDRFKGPRLVEMLERAISLYREADSRGLGIDELESDTGAPGLVDAIAKMVRKAPSAVRRVLLHRERTPDGVTPSPKPPPLDAALSMLTALGVSGRSTINRRKKLAKPSRSKTAKTGLRRR